METYTQPIEFTNYFGENEPLPTPYGRTEDVSILLLEEYSFAFPTLIEFREMETSNPNAYINIKKAILEQMKYYYENAEEIDNPIATQAYSVGRVSVSASSAKSETQMAREKISPIAKKYMDASGIVVTAFCSTSKNRCKPNCGCDFL